MKLIPITPHAFAGVLLLTVSTTAVEPPTVAWWRMETRQGDQIPDLSGNGHTLTVYGSPTFDGDAVVFNADGYLIAADSDDLDLASGDWTISFWAREDSNDYGPYGNPTNMWFAKVRAYFDFEGGWASWAEQQHGVGTDLYGSPNCSHRTGEALTLGTWYHIATTYEDATNTLRIHVNGIKKLESVNTCSPFSECVDAQNWRRANVRRFFPVPLQGGNGGRAHL